MQAVAREDRGFVIFRGPLWSVSRESAFDRVPLAVTLSDVPEFTNTWVILSFLENQEITMPLLNSATHYGAVTRFLHWAVFLLFAYQYVVANIMTRIESGKSVFSFTQDD